MTTISSLTDDKKFLSPTELAKYLGISRTVSYSLFKETDFPCIKIGRRKFVMWKDFYEWAKRTKSANLLQEGGDQNEL